MDVTLLIYITYTLLRSSTALYIWRIANDIDFRSRRLIHNLYSGDRTLKELVDRFFVLPCEMPLTFFSGPWCIYTLWHLFVKIEICRHINKLPIWHHRDTYSRLKGELHFQTWRRPIKTLPRSLGASDYVGAFLSLSQRSINGANTIGDSRRVNVKANDSAQAHKRIDWVQVLQSNEKMVHDIVFISQLSAVGQGHQQAMCWLANMHWNKLYSIVHTHVDASMGPTLGIALLSQNVEMIVT